MGGIIPAGIWVMDEARSRKLTPGSLSLWVLRDDGDQLVWVSVETDSEGRIAVHSFDGRYGGPPTTVLGNGFVVSLTSPAPRRIQVTGDIPGMGAFRELSEVSQDGRRMLVSGEVGSGGDVRTWYEEFNWQGPSPHRA
ncbi:hypothetical protein B2G71_04540 [Novosphingobium sp. PC22D]|uniref:hypothetical protein n=1 Tax=Novosphingobium sp. PC22D TaxID=1962403 RepID=UPI000BF14385|nr:hypothetical protein [Novosphingobium sp. PC22D]PEQ13605.1 hypothetical protein B2G71_04540 [Novosphingobium sp. PC22D]